MSSHTPGPWLARFGLADEGFTIGTPEKPFICEYWPAALTRTEQETMRSNAAVICAAPTLYEAWQSFFAAQDALDAMTADSNGEAAEARRLRSDALATARALVEKAGAP